MLANISIVKYDIRLLQNSPILRLICVIGALFFCAGPSLCSAAPRLVFEKTLVDIGEISEDQSPEAEFRFSNKGDQPLVITEIGGSCRCHVLRVTSETLLPGESASLIAAVSTRYRIGPATDLIKVKSNDPDNPIQVLQIKQFVVKRTLAIPDRLYIDLSENSEDSRTIKILGPNNDNTFEVLEVSSNMRRITLGKPTCASEPNEARRLWKFSVKATNAPGHNVAQSGSIEVTTNDKKKPVITIPVTLLENIPITIHPRTLTFIHNDYRPPRSKRIQVLWSRSSPQTDTALDIAPAAQYQVTIVSQTSAGSSKQWLVEIKPPSESAVTTRFKTNDIILLFPQIDIELVVPLTLIDTRAGPTHSAMERN